MTGKAWEGRGPTGRGRRSSAALLTAALALLAAHGPAAAQFSVNPAIVDLAVEGESRTATLTLHNHGVEEMQFRIYGEDFEQRMDGDHLFLEFGSHPSSCAGRLSIAPAELVLRPDERQPVQLRMGPGDGSCWSLAIVETVGAVGVGIQAVQRIGVKVHGLRPEATVGGEITEVSISSSPAGHALAFSFENTGEAPLRPDGRVEMRSLTGEVLGEAPVEAFNILPGRVRTLEVAWEDPLPPGQYLAVPILDYGGSHLAAGQGLFEVP